MSSGRKNQTSKFRTTGTDKQSLLESMTQNSGGPRKDLTRDTKTFTKDSGLGYSDDDNVIADRKALRAEAQKHANTLVDLSQETIDSLNVRFKERANEVISRNTFKGREQLVLTNR